MEDDSEIEGCAKAKRGKLEKSDPAKLVEFNTHQRFKN